MRYKLILRDQNYLYTQLKQRLKKKIDYNFLSGQVDCCYVKVSDKHRDKNKENTTTVTFLAAQIYVRYRLHVSL